MVNHAFVCRRLSLGQSSFVTSMVHSPLPPSEEPNSACLEPFASEPVVQPDAEVRQLLLENQALRQQIATQTQLMHLLTHQLATPLTTLSGSVQLLAEPCLEPEQRQEFLSLVQHQVYRLQELLGDLVALRDLETGVLETHPTEFTLPELAAEVLADFKPLQAKGMFEPGLPVIWGDRWQVSQVLANLLSNAFKYSPSHSPVEIGAHRLPSGWVEVWVRDQGLGIPLEDQPHLFERFYRVKHGDRQHIEGTGLGLSLCKVLVENQGGQIRFESTHGVGSCFFFTLPSVGSGEV
jgi:signal transduction histidine kinase